MKYAKAVRIARSIADISQGELADRAGLDRSYLSLIEGGKRKPTMETLQTISEALEMPFPLLTLLAVEKQDSKNINNEQVLGLAKQLTYMLLETQNIDDGEQTLNKASSGKPKRPRTSTRGKAGRPGGYAAKSQRALQAVQNGEEVASVPRQKPSSKSEAVETEGHR